MTEIANNLKTRGRLVLQRRARSGAWRNYLAVDVPRHLRYSASVTDGTLTITFDAHSDQAGTWEQVVPNVELGYFVSLKGARSVELDSPLVGPAWVRQSPEGVPLEIRIGSDPLSS